MKRLASCYHKDRILLKAWFSVACSDISAVEGCLQAILDHADIPACTQIELDRIGSSSDHSSFQLLLQCSPESYISELQVMFSASGSKGSISISDIEKSVCQLLSCQINKGVRKCLNLGDDFPFHFLEESFIDHISSSLSFVFGHGCFHHLLRVADTGKDSYIGLKNAEFKSEGYGFLGLALRQRLINRWALRHCVHQENVLEHVGMVVTLCLLAGYISRQLGTPVNMEKLLGHAALHDSPETLTQDLISPVKNASPELAEAYRKLEVRAINNMLAMVPEEIRSDLSESLLLSEGYEYRLFKACDTYAAYIKCRLEVAYGNEIEFSKALLKQGQKIEDFCSEIPAIAALHKWFGPGIDLPLDDLLQMTCTEHPAYPISV